MKNLLLLVTALMLMVASVVTAGELDIDESSVVTFASKRGVKKHIINVESYGQALTGKEAWVGMDQDISIKAKADATTGSSVYVYAFSVDSNNKLTVLYNAKALKANQEATKNLKVKDKKATYYLIISSKKEAKLDNIAKKANKAIGSSELSTLNKMTSNSKINKKVTLRTE